MKSMSPMEKRICKRMLDAGEALEDIAERINKPLHEVRVYAVRLANLRKCRITTGANQKHKTHQLCWDCRLASGRASRRTQEPCPWAARREPVPGWDAAATTQQYNEKGASRKVLSYDIRDCPLFENDGE